MPTGVFQDGTLCGTTAEAVEKERRGGVGHCSSTSGSETESRCRDALSREWFCSHAILVFNTTTDWFHTITIPLGQEGRKEGRGSTVVPLADLVEGENGA